MTGLCIERDAISNSVLHQRQVLVEAGCEVRVFAHHSDVLGGDDLSEIRDPWILQREEFYRNSDLVVFHYGIHYGLFNALQLGHGRARTVLHFHNVTPPELLSGASALQANRAVDQISIASLADVVWVDSEHNSDCLVEWSDVDLAAVRPMALCVPWLPEVDEDATDDRRTGDEVRLLTVGRMVAAKGLHDLVAAVAALPAPSRDRVQLTLVGSRAHSDDAYIDELCALIRVHGLEDSVELVFDPDDAALQRRYDRADLFVSPSHHEGFCVPVVEALVHGCRVVTTDAGALPDTVGDCGEVVPLGDVGAMSQAIGRSIAAGPLSHEELHRASVHVHQFSLPAFRRRLLHEVHRALAPATDQGDPMANGPEEAARYVARQRRLLGVLACPMCRGQLRIDDALEVRSAVAAGDLVCAEHGRVGVIDQFRPSFLARELDHIPAGDPARPLSLELAVDDPSLTLLGDWQPVAEGVRAAGTGEESITLDAEGRAVVARFFAHDWSGRVTVEVEGGEQVEVDLYRASPQEVRVEVPLSSGSHRVHVLVAGERADAAAAAQVVVAGFEVLVDPEHGRLPGVGAVNRGNPYPPRFIDLVATAGPDALILDCGGGDRRFGDDRVLNLEYLDYTLPDLYGDGLALGIADDSFDLILSQAVLEHVPDPQLAVDEMVRILRPGGLIYIEVAFMQPLHAVPSHYMNVTPFGVDYLCRDLERLDGGVFGGLAETIGWIGRLVGAESKIGESRFASVIESLTLLDEQLSDAELAQAASAVWLLGRKPLR